MPALANTPSVDRKEARTTGSTASCANAACTGSHNRGSWIDLLVAVIVIATYALWIYTFRYRGLLGEDDLYRMLVGLLDGARQHTGLASPNHYGKAFSFGYIAAIFHLASPATLADPSRLIELMNAIGLWSAAASCFLFWLLAWLLYGLRAASVAVILFALSPMMLELGTSGHPILPAFALFTAAALCLLAPVRGRLSVFLWMAGTVLLLAAMTVRAEVGLALPFLVLAQANFGPLRDLAKSVIRRSIAPALAVAAFLALKHCYADSTAGSGQLIPFLRQFIRIREIPVGVYVFTLSCGALTTLAGLVTCALIAHRLLGMRAIAAKSAQSVQQRKLLNPTAAPLVLIAVPMAFFLANPRPGRHFILCLAGISLLTAWLIARRFARRPLTTYALVFAVVLGNQALGAVTGPWILAYAPSKILIAPDGTHHLPRGVPTGSSSTYHRAFAAEETRTNVFAALAAHPCDDKTLVLSLNATQIFADIYVASSAWDPTEQLLGKFPMQQARIGSRTVLVLSENEGWPADAAAQAMRDPAFRNYKLVRDPNSLSIYDRSVIPSDRSAHLGCAP